MMIAIILLLLLIQLAIPVRAVPAGFTSKGPVLTITLRDPSPPVDDEDDATTTARRQPWLPIDLSSLRPNLVYSISSQQPPLPNWLPALKSLSLGAGYEHGATATASPAAPLGWMTAAPSWIETTAKFDFPDLCQLQVQPSHELSSSTTNVLLQLSRGAHYAWAKVLHHHSNHHTLRLATAQVSALVRLPLASLAAVRISPTWNSNNNNNSNSVVAPHHRRGEITCDVEAVTGGPGRTRAVLHLEYEHPTLAVQYQPTPRHLIRPVLDLFSGKMVYQWILALQKGGSLQVQVDPERDVTMQWNDPSSSNRGVWLTNVRVPLEQPWRVDVRVRRQFAF